MPSILNLKNADCRYCHRCVRRCPVKAIRFSARQAHIITDECIYCGQCFVVCPQGAKEIVDDTERVRVMLQSEAPVIASIDPSFYACWNNCGINSITKALKELGFTDAEETARGATLVKREYEKQIANKEQSIIISSSCHSINLLIEKHYPDLRKHLSPVVSPMIAHALEIKKRIPEAKVVFIGPCVSRKDEAVGTAVDAVLTFEELDQMFLAAKIEIEPEFGESEAGRTRGFPIAGGIIKSMDLPDNGYTYLSVSGTKECIFALKDLQNGDIENCFIEMSLCDGGCINGPIMEKYINSPVRHMNAVLKNVGTEDFDIPQPEDGSLFMQHNVPAIKQQMPTEAEITEILHKLGKYKPEDELNCGTCGYNTCRDKAIAIFRGNADYTMCLPAHTERAERFSNKILNNMPSGVVVVNEDLEVQQLNRTAMKLMNIDHESDVLGDSVVRILDTAPFFSVLESGKTVKKRRGYFSDYDKYFEQTIVYDRSSHILIDIISDVTEEEADSTYKKKLGRETAEIADRVVENQMRIVQEIASLLGETTAETKIALTKLKESMNLNDN
ncbi:MAG: [Fe-Fe] hydrogenase large subunit C-terminal domain-containing protein [Bacillota bacterium]|nr:[Fe-Fe] hydrogenase large subunit C-terminal domain-containing protein [Bacillota bacterium]